MINFENVLSILKKEYFKINKEILRLDFDYNNYHIYFLYRPTFIEDGRDLFVFNAYVNNSFICQPLNFINNSLKTRINEDIYPKFREISPYPNAFFEEVKTKIIESKINFSSSNFKEMTKTFDIFYKQYPNLEFDKPYFWRFTALPKNKSMSTNIEMKLKISYGLSSEIISLLKKIRRTAQFTLNPKKEKSINIALSSLKIDN